METSRQEPLYNQYGLSHGLYSPPRYLSHSQQSRNPMISPTSPPGPSSSSKRDRILVVVTVDAERYTPVDVTDFLNDGPTIRTKICNKLGILDPTEQAQSLIYETEIGSDALGHSLTDDILSSMCRDRGDSKGSLAFIVERPGSRRRVARRGRSSPLSPDYQSSDIESMTSDHSNVGATQPQAQSSTTRRRNRSHAVDSRTQPQPPPTPESTYSLSNGFRSPPHRHAQPRDPTGPNSTSPTATQAHTNLVLSGLNGIHNQNGIHPHALPPTPDEPFLFQPPQPNQLPSPPAPELSPQQPRQPRRVRPLPAIPTPTSAPSPGPPLSSGADHYSRSTSMTTTITSSTSSGSNSTSPNLDNIDDFYA